MISFVVLGGPRSGTTWAANWLTTDHTVCLHDPLLEYKLPQLNALYFPGKKLGISCTSSLLYPDWLNSLKVPKVVLYRSVPEINQSLAALGLVQLDEIPHLDRILAIKDVKLVPYEQLFEAKSAKEIADFLGVPFDYTRHDLLRQMRVEPMWRSLNVGRQAVADLVKRIKEAA